MAGTVADYKVLRDKSFFLEDKAGKDTKRFGFGLPGKFHGGSGPSHMGIFSFGLGEVKADLKFDIYLNGEVVYHSGYVKSLPLSQSDRTIQEAFDSSILRVQDNEVTVQIREGSGRFHDLIIWFQRDT
ncbi:hypothetical protein Lepto7375DRAFT_1015 [Leptolyngbya sp. PCC 7375]|nr:hypothetical protein Lepto7375DRAFT_1015 [Leptolyngbya sp. PCC 7375]